MTQRPKRGICASSTNNIVHTNNVRQHTGELDLKDCFGERLAAPEPKRAAVPRGVVLIRGEVLRKVSLRRAGPVPRPDRAGSTGTAPGSPTPVFFLLEGGIREAGKLVGSGSFSMVRYTRCIACKMESITNYYK